MARMYRRLDDRSVENLTLHETLTEAEFDSRVARAAAALVQVDAEISALVPLEVPEGSSPEVEQAIADYNMTYFQQEMDGLLHKKATIEFEIALMDGV